ncbi:RteC protein [Chryseobacterium arachidis]|uniref:RteC protein n=1 Tax=Chryseobacterium arachidis TaxID=1416778 RepID=A0A1M5C344_9FLAO|nr:RteC domain-containing protein [Chryseobacterium arachidis]SHF49204.1 RteC protein [Chryseobacterium arachidis]
MVNKLFRTITKMYDHLERDLKIIADAHDDPIRVAEESLSTIDQSIRELKSLIIPVIFNEVAEEVYFFKQLKPLFISKYIYFMKVLSIVSSVPHSNEKTLKKYYENEWEKLKEYHRDNADFYNYYRRKATYMDHKYFVRNSFDLKMKLSFNLYDLDENFTTSHCDKVAHILANDLLEKFLKKESEKDYNLLAKNESSATSLKWSASKVAFIELAYALHQSNCFNGGNIEFSEIIRFFEKTLNFDLGNYYKTITEIRDRKNGRTKFLHMISANLDQHFKNIDNEFI